MGVRSTVSAFLCFLLLMPASWAQDQAAVVPSTGPTVFRTDTRLVVIHASVVGTDGKLIENLPQSAFTIYENGEKQELKVFRSEDIPVSLGLVIDNSASMHDKRPKVNAASLDLVRASNPEDEVFIMNFDDEPSIAREFTSNINELEEGLKMARARGATAMRDALRLGIEHLKHKGKKEKKVLLVVSDGEDNASIETLDHLVRVAQSNEVLIYAVGLLRDEDPRSAERAKKALDALTQATGGLSYYPQDISEIDRIAREVAHEIRHQYTLAYTPTNLNQDGTFRKIKVDVQGPQVASVRTRSGYYASGS
jgi:Ca-activated chloride channel family protein